MANRHVAKIEKRALQLSLFGTFAASGAGLLVGFLVNSQAILLDGIFSLLSMGMTGLALYTTQLIHRPEDDTFQFGYSHLEPLTIMLQGLVILAICVIALVTGIKTLMKGGVAPLRIDFALIYAIAITCLCFAIYFFEKRIAGASKSEMIRVDAQEWLIDGILSSTLLFGFVLAFIFNETGHGDWNHYIDPILTIALSILASFLPIRVLSKNIKDVLLVSPLNNEKLQDEVESIIDEYGFADYSCHFAKSGRQYDLEINLLVDNPEYWTMAEQDALRHVIYDRLIKDLGKTWLTISFTAERRWL